MPTPTPVTLGPAVTGINPWWTYEEGAIPGVGKYMLNVGTGNLLVQADDVDIPERGIDLAFRRTYNSMSHHDANNSDGSTTSVFGNGWTNTFDAHMAYNGTSNVMSVYDIDGARYDYAANGTGGWNPPPGVHSQLTYDGSCGYLWTKKSGTTYHFWSPAMGSNCGGAAYNGRLYMILGRNQNNWVRFDYSWAGGNSSTAANLTQINAVHADGQTITLRFGAANGVGPNELLSITRTDGAVINYYYDNSGNLQEVDRPGNNAASVLPETYAYTNGVLVSVNSPRYVLSYRATGGNPSDGDVVNLAYSSGAVTQVANYGLTNFTPADGMNQVLQSGMPTALGTWSTANYAYTGGTTSMSDSDGHSRIWTFDTLNRVIQTQVFVTSNFALATSASWDADNNLVEAVDARGNATDYSYDSNGNTVEVAEPAQNAGGTRPTSLYSYDGYNNVIAYCDPIETNSIGKSWTATPAPNSTPCPSQAGATRYVWNATDTAEPDGYITDAYTPLGYHHNFQYNQSVEGGDFGLPTSVTGDPITQTDGTSRTPTQTFAYDSYGNLTGYNRGEGSWTLTYDTTSLGNSGLNRLLIAKDPDGYSSYTCYFANGQVQYTETPAQHAADQNPSSCKSTSPMNSAWSTYDADGNVGTTNDLEDPNDHESMYYDGADRKVEDVSGAGIKTRYLYDLTQNGAFGTISFNGGAAFSAHGGLYGTQETGSVAQFRDLRGWAYDGLDRAVKQFIFSAAASGVTLNYDTDAQHYGLLASRTDELGVVTSYAYDNDDN